MARVNLFIFIIICLSISSVKATPDSLINYSAYKIKIGYYKDFYVDNLGFIYLVSENNQIKKYNNRLDSIAIYNNGRLGNIFSVDVSNPLKIQVYYKDYGLIVTLDQELNSENVINLSSASNQQSNFIINSYDNNLWLFDLVNNKLKKIDYLGNLLLETQDFRLLFETPFYPTQILDYNSTLFLYDMKLGEIKAFNYFGSLINQFYFPKVKTIFIDNGNIISYDSTALIFCNTKYTSTQLSKIYTNLNFSAAQKVIIKKGCLYLLNKEGLHIYKRINFNE